MSAAARPTCWSAAASPAWCVAGPACLAGRVHDHRPGAGCPGSTGAGVEGRLRRVAPVSTMRATHPATAVGWRRPSIRLVLASNLRTGRRRRCRRRSDRAAPAVHRRAQLGADPALPAHGVREPVHGYAQPRGCHHVERWPRAHRAKRHRLRRPASSRRPTARPRASLQRWSEDRHRWTVRAGHEPRDHLAPAGVHRHRIVLQPAVSGSRASGYGAAPLRPLAEGVERQQGRSQRPGSGIVAVWSSRFARCRGAWPAAPRGSRPSRCSTEQGAARDAGGRGNVVGDGVETSALNRSDRRPRCRRGGGTAAPDPGCWCG